MKQSIWIGWEPREADAFAVCHNTIRNQLNTPIPVRGLVLSKLREQGFYTRQHTRKDGRLWDIISDAPMATEFACSRFLVPHVVRQLPRSDSSDRWAMFLDCDMMVRKNMDRLFENLDPTKAVYCVQHQHEPIRSTKMDGQLQTLYARKNWSSVMIFNVDHPSNDALDLDTVNTLPGRDLHRFCWLEDDEIGELNQEWNYLVGQSCCDHPDPTIVHFTDGVPSMMGYENSEYSRDWRKELDRWAISAR